MSNTLTNPENVTESAGRDDVITATASPRPWRVEGLFLGQRETKRQHGFREYANVLDRNGIYIAQNLPPETAVLIVDAVNYYKPDLHCDWRELTPEEAVAHCREVATRLGDTPCARDHLQLAAWIEERDRLRDELDAERSQHATDIEQAEYHAEHHRKRLEAERDRLRDIVRRMAAYIQVGAIGGALVREARAAIGEDKP